MRSLAKTDLSKPCSICRGVMNYSGKKSAFVCENCGFQDKSF